MNKKDLKELSKPQPITPAASTIPVFTSEEFRAAIETVAKELQPKEPSRILDEPWWQAYVAVCGNHTGWLVSAVDADRLQQRLTKLAAVTNAIVNNAINLKKVSR